MGILNIEIKMMGLVCGRRREKKIDPMFIEKL